jgi:sugar-specific transcriptional regulator TrmB
VLERAGLITYTQVAQSRPRRIVGAPLKEATDWLEKYRKFWEESFERLDELLDKLKLESSPKGSDIRNKTRRKKNAK